MRAILGNARLTTEKVTVKKEKYKETKKHKKAKKSLFVFNDLPLNPTLTLQKLL